MTRLLTALLALLPVAAQSELSMNTTRYTCDRGVEVPATYVNDQDGGSVAILSLEGRQISLFSEPTGSGARYGWPSDGANYVWSTKGSEASLYWKEAGAETLILGNCKEAS
ncbi:MAG: MliC family protein [Pseudomonadota bacterium]